MGYQLDTRHLFAAWEHSVGASEAEQVFWLPQSLTSCPSPWRNIWKSPARRRTRKFVTTMSNLIEFYCEGFFGKRFSIVIVWSRKNSIKIPRQGSISFGQFHSMFSNIFCAKPRAWKKSATSCMSKHYLDPSCSSLWGFFEGKESFVGGTSVEHFRNVKLICMPWGCCRCDAVDGDGFSFALFVGDKYSLNRNDPFSF